TAARSQRSCGRRGSDPTCRGSTCRCSDPAGSATMAASAACPASTRSGTRSCGDAGRASSTAPRPTPPTWRITSPATCPVVDRSLLGADVPEQLDPAAQRQPVADVFAGELNGAGDEVFLADVLDGFVARSRRCHRPGVQLGGGVLEEEWDLEALLDVEPTVRETRLADAGEAERHHVGLVLDLLLGRPEERCEHPGARRLADISPAREREPTARDQHPSGLVDGVRGRTPDAAE